MFLKKENKRKMAELKYEKYFIKDTGFPPMRAGERPFGNEIGRAHV
jgi:hypothetical protein